MLVNEIKTYKIKINNEEIELKLDFNALIKMHKEYGSSFLLIDEFVYKNDLSKMPLILKCMANKEISEDDIRNMAININTLETLAAITLDLINEEVMGKSEFEIKSEVKKNQKIEEEKKK